MDSNESKRIAQEFFDRLHKGASRLVAAGREHRPLMVVIDDAGDDLIVGGLASMPKDAVAHYFKTLSEQPWVKCCALIMESWVFKAHEDNADEQRIAQLIREHKMSVSEAPRREEVIVFNIVAAGKQWMSLCDIERKTNTLAKGELIDPQPAEGKPDFVVGRFVHGSTPEMQKDVEYAATHKKDLH